MDDANPLWRKALILGWTVGFVACLIGLVISYVGDFTYGPSLVLSLGLFFVVAMVIRAWIMRRPRCASVPEVNHG